MQLTLLPRRILLALSAIVVLLTIANAAVLWVKFRWGHDSLYGLTPLFDFNREGNLPAFYSACSLLLAAVLFLVIAGQARKCNDPLRRHWAGLGAVFLFLAVDEAAELHGLLSLPLRRLAHTEGPLFFAWVIPYGILTLAFAVAYLRFFWALPRQPRLLLGVAGVVYVVGALGLELVGGAMVSARGGLDAALDYWLHAVFYTIEEILEMAGVLIAIYALLQYIATQRITLSLRAAAE